MTFEWKATLFSQYANSPVLLAMVDAFSEAIDAQQEIDEWIADIWDVSSARGWGLDVWGRIVGVQRVIPVSGTKFLGFNEAGNISADPFGQSPFYPGFFSQANYPLPDDDFKTLIYAKAAANIWDGSIPGYNRILRLLFPGFPSFIQDNQNMSMTIVLGFSPSPVQQSILFNTGVLPRPTGVSISYV